MPTLIITLPTTAPDSGTVLDIVVSERGTVVRQDQCPASLLAQQEVRERVALVPASKLSWHRVTLPKGVLGRGLFADGRDQRLRTVLDSLLEDQLLDEPETLHLALQAQPEVGEPVWVVACERDWLRGWLEALEQAGTRIDRIVPAMAPLPSDAPVKTLVRMEGDVEQAWVQLCNTEGVVLMPWSSATEHWLSQHLGETDQRQVQVEPALAHLAETWLQAPFELQTRAQAAVEALACGWDLAQFDLLRTRGARARNGLGGVWSRLSASAAWRPARWAAAAGIVIHLLGMQAWAWKENQALQARRDAIRTTLTTTFPDIRVVVDAPTQMARAVTDLKRNSGVASSSDLESMLTQFAVAAPLGGTPATLGYQDGEMRMTGLAPELATDAAVTQRLQARGYSLRLDGSALVLAQRPTP